METTTGRQESAAAPAGGSSPGHEGAPAWTAVSRGVALFLVARRMDWHRKYLDYRALAEGLRVLFYWRVAGVTDASGTTSCL